MASMDNNNPAEMSNEDLEKDMQQRNDEDGKGNQEHVQKSTATEGELLTPATDPASAPKIDASGFIVDENAHVGNMPDPEALDSWESNDDDPNKLSS
ncbi:hypothetical protein SAE01_05130 [Segetibacter aerophilus]|uniref:Uncharacterized protein n=2 Tax=Segetibacter aerophilus TaxID=670293 RepID=A0A512B867_9BACT|nr:hypothetical protein SAE01_05130 [Segetibacter aerophilus]